MLYFTQVRAAFSLSCLPKWTIRRANKCRWYDATSMLRGYVNVYRCSVHGEARRIG